MSSDQILLYASLAGLIVLVPSIPLLFISIRGSARRAIYRLSLPKRQFKPATPSNVARALLNASMRNSATKTENVATLARCIDYYAFNKTAVETSLIEELMRLNQDDLKRLVVSIDEVGANVERTSIVLTERRLTQSKGHNDHHGWLDVRIVQQMAVRGSLYYVRDFIEEIKNAITKIESLRS